MFKPNRYLYLVFGIVAVLSLAFFIGCTSSQQAAPPPPPPASTTTIPGTQEVSTPTFSPAAGSYTADSMDITISTSTSGASIYYTLDGSTPTTASTPYTTAIHLTTSKTIKAIAVLTGYTDSTVASAAYGLQGEQPPQSGWVPVGTLELSAGNAESPALDVYNGTPYIIYGDGTKDKKATVMKFDGTNWVPVGNQGFSDGEALYTSIFVYGGTPYVAYADRSYGNNALVVKKFNGTTWIPVGPTYISLAGPPANIRLYVYNEIPYVAYLDMYHYFKTQRPGGEWEEYYFIQAVGLKYDGETWNNFFSTNWPSLVVSLDIYNNVPYVAFGEGAYDYEASVNKYDGSNWVYVGNAAFSGTSVIDMRLVIDKTNGIPYVSFNSEPGIIAVKKFNGTSWEQVGSIDPSHTGFLLIAPELQIYNSTPYIAYLDSYYTNKITVKKYVTGNWVPVGAEHFSNSVWRSNVALDGTIPLSFRIDSHDGTPYVAYRNSVTNKANVMKYIQ